MVNDVIEIKLNGKSYNARLDMGAIATAQNNLQKLKENITVVEMFDLVKKDNYSVINNIIISSIQRMHSQLSNEQILENMKLYERNNIKLYVYELIKASLPTDDKKKEQN